MSWRKILVYFLFLLILTALYGYQQVRNKRIQQKKEAQKQICPLSLEQIKSYTLKTEYGLFQVVKKGKKWRLTEPVEDWANSSTSTQLLETVIKTRIERKITPLPKDLSPYGLDRPRIEITLLSDKKKWGLKLGGNTPDGRRVYALSSDKNGIYLFPTNLLWSLNKRPGDLRDKHILDFDPVKVSRISLQGKEINVSLEKQKGQWYIKVPFKAKADNDEVDTWLYKLQAEQVDAFIEKQCSPQLKIELGEGRNSPPYWLKIAFQKEGIVGQSSYHPGGFSLRKEFRKEFVKSPEFFKDRHFIEFNKEAVNKIEIIYGKKHLLAQKNKEKWEVTPKNLAEPYEIEFFLEDLINLKYLPHQKTPSQGLASWQARVKLWDKKAQLVLDIKCYKEKGQSWVEYKGKFYQISNNFWKRFPIKMRGKKEE